MNNNQNQEPTFYQKNGWWIWILTGLLVLSLFFRNLEFKNPFFKNEIKKDTAIINTINNNGNKIVDAINHNSKKIGGKIDTANNISREILDTLKEIKKDTKKISVNKCCIEKLPCKPKPVKKACLVKLKPSPKFCPEPKKYPCPYDVLIDGQKYIYYNGTVPDSDNGKRVMKLKAGPRGSKDEGKWFIPGERIY